MFSGIGFFELLVIGGVGLLVIGPERLPDTIKTVALWIGRLKRSLTETRREIETQLGADEIRRELHNEQVMASLEKFREQAGDLKERINSHMQDSSEEVSSLTAPNEDAHHDHHHDHHHDDHAHDIHEHSTEGTVIEADPQVDATTAPNTAPVHNDSSSPEIAKHSDAPSPSKPTEPPQ